MKRHLVEYIPFFLRSVREYREIYRVEEEEYFDTNKIDPAVLIDERFIDTASETRIAEWENALNIVPSGTLAERKLFLKATIRGYGKLSETKIEGIVNAFTGGTATVTFEDSTLKVSIDPPPNGENFEFSKVSEVLEKLKPAHLGLEVTRNYASWNDIKTDFTDWQEVNDTFTDWQALYSYIKG